jgi:hypothetical protein
MTENGESWVIVYRIDNVDVGAVKAWWDGAWSTDGTGAPLGPIQDTELPYQIALEVSDGDADPRAFCGAVFSGNQPSQNAIEWLGELWALAEAGTPVLMEKTVSRVLIGTLVPAVEGNADIGRHILVKPLRS